MKKSDILVNGKPLSDYPGITGRILRSPKTAVANQRPGWTDDAAYLKAEANLMEAKNAVADALKHARKMSLALRKAKAKRTAKNG